MDKHNHDHEQVHADRKELEAVGKISYEALIKARDMVKPGVKLLDVADAVENFVREKGYTCAFPLNLSINEQAAHYTPSFMDDKVFTENDIVKVDFGAAKEGVLGDCAVTVDLTGQYSKLVDASRMALDNALSMIKIGVKVGDIGKEIAKTIESAGYKPVMNLGGHGVGVHNLHAEIFIPNYDNKDETTLEEGEVIAIEPFVTTGKKGLIAESGICDIYNFAQECSVRLPSARDLLKEIQTNHNSEPFAVRWLANKQVSKFGLYAAVNELVRAGALTPHPTLVGLDNGMIAQSEVEVIVEKDSCVVLTK